ncbi:MAG: GNAT family N-acetyltransferase [bacterium]|nr:GNAT family N-acetyltransferase [bacterium]
MKKEDLTFRQATVKDVGQMLNLVNRNASKGVMLPKSKGQILDLLTNFSVAVRGEKVVATCGFKIWMDESAEIISLATLKRFQGQGVGTKLIQENIERCKNLGIKRFFAMTVAPKVFTRINFKVVHYNRLSFKVWMDCSNCPRNAAGPGDKKCNEQAVELLLD